MGCNNELSGGQRELNQRAGELRHLVAELCNRRDDMKALLLNAGLSLDDLVSLVWIRLNGWLADFDAIPGKLSTMVNRVAFHEATDQSRLETNASFPKGADMDALHSATPRHTDFVSDSDHLDMIFKKSFLTSREIAVVADRVLYEKSFYEIAAEMNVHPSRAGQIFRRAAAKIKIAFPDSKLLLIREEA